MKTLVSMTMLGMRSVPDHNIALPNEEIGQHAAAKSASRRKVPARAPVKRGGGKRQPVPRLNHASFGGSAVRARGGVFRKQAFPTSSVQAVPMGV